MMETALCIIEALLLNTFLGAVVWASIDDDEQRLFAWFNSCPPQLAPFVQPLVLNAWPGGLWFWWRITF